MSVAMAPTTWLLLASRFATASTLPIMLDSTEPAVLQAGLEHLGGRYAVNSVNYEDGDGPGLAFQNHAAVKQHGATVVALTIDEKARRAPRKWKVRIRRAADRDLHRELGSRRRGHHHRCPHLPDALDRGRGATRRHRDHRGDPSGSRLRTRPSTSRWASRTSRSASIRPRGRYSSSVFLHECVQAGMDTAIVHASKIVPMARIPLMPASRGGTRPRLRPSSWEPMTCSSSWSCSRACRRRPRASTRFWELAKLPLFSRLERRIVDGERAGLEDDLDAAMKEKPPLVIINETLLSGMKTVGELFGSGQMQLPFVLQSAEVMKAAVASGTAYGRDG